MLKAFIHSCHSAQSLFTLGFPSTKPAYLRKSLIGWFPVWALLPNSMSWIPLLPSSASLLDQTSHPNVRKIWFNHIILTCFIHMKFIHCSLNKTYWKCICLLQWNHLLHVHYTSSIPSSRADLASFLYEHTWTNGFLTDEGMDTEVKTTNYGVRVDKHRPCSIKAMWSRIVTELYFPFFSSTTWMWLQMCSPLSFLKKFFRGIGDLAQW